MNSMNLPLVITGWIVFFVLSIVVGKKKNRLKEGLLLGGILGSLGFIILLFLKKKEITKGKNSDNYEQ